MKDLTIATTGRASYCPEDDKLRLYVGRVPREEYEALRAEGWTSTPKQDCDFVAVWTPSREDTALLYADGIIEDEDQSPADRAADRAERFAGYRDHRIEDATGKADAYDAGPAVHGYQSQALAERRANRHDALATRAVNFWDKAEYWQQRTAGVISHALHVSTPAVRMGRIKILEAEIRKREKANEEYKTTFERWEKLSKETDTEKQTKLALAFANILREFRDYKHPRNDKTASLYMLLDGAYTGDPITGAEACKLYLDAHVRPEDCKNRNLNHIKLRLAYENQMLEAQGGRAAFVEMVAGGWIGSHQIQKVNKSPVTGRVVSVAVLLPTRASFDRKGKAYGADNPKPLVLANLNIERLQKEVYRAPTAEELTAFEEAKKAEKKERKANAAPTIPLINPTNEDAEKLQAYWNSKKSSWGETKQKPVLKMTQVEYSNISGGSYSKAETLYIKANGDENHIQYRGNVQEGASFKVRVYGYDPRQVIVITDKPQKPLPIGILDQPEAIAV